jgi:hypothetical protein
MLFSSHSADQWAEVTAAAEQTPAAPDNVFGSKTANCSGGPKLFEHVFVIGASQSDMERSACSTGAVSSQHEGAEKVPAKPSKKRYWSSWRQRKKRSSTKHQPATLTEGDSTPKMNSKTVVEPSLLYQFPNDRCAVVVLLVPARNLDLLHAWLVSVPCTSALSLWVNSLLLHVYRPGLWRWMAVVRSFLGYLTCKLSEYFWRLSFHIIKQFYRSVLCLL